MTCPNICLQISAAITCLTTGAISKIGVVRDESGCACSERLIRPWRPSFHCFVFTNFYSRLLFFCTMQSIGGPDIIVALFTAAMAKIIGSSPVHVVMIHIYIIYYIYRVKFATPVAAPQYCTLFGLPLSNRCSHRLLLPASE